MAKKKSSWKLDLSLDNVLNCAAYALIGLLLVILQGGSIGILMTVVGVLVAALGVMDIFQKKDTATGIVELAVGIIIIVCGWVIANIILFIFGLVLIVKGAMEIWENRKKGFDALLSPIVTVVIGAVLAFAWGSLVNICCIIAGVIFLINAVLVLFGKSLTK